jgi:hypothetical protein
MEHQDLVLRSLTALMQPWRAAMKEPEKQDFTHVTWQNHGQHSSTGSSNTLLSAGQPGDHASFEHWFLYST